MHLSNPALTVRFLIENPDDSIKEAMLVKQDDAEFVFGYLKRRNSSAFREDTIL